MSTEEMTPETSATEQAESGQTTNDTASQDSGPDALPIDAQALDGAPKKKRRRRRSKKKAAGGETLTETGTESDGETAAAGESDDRPTDAGQPEGDGEAQPKKKRRRRRRKGGRDGDSEGGGESEAAQGEKRRAPAVHHAAADVSNVEVFEQEITFADLGLNEEILASLGEVGFLQPTYIQAQLIPPALTGRDVLGQAKTGTGKTAAFGLPLLQMCEPGVPMQTIVLAPTRELAIQITDEINDLGRHSPLTAITIYGGQRINTQVEKLQRGPEIIVGTPGRVQDMVGRGLMHFKNVRFAVLDEVDRMFDIGFREDIRRILGMCPRERQTIVVSATFNREIEDLARRYMRDPEKIVTSAGSLTASLVEQHYLSVEPWDKRRLLTHLLTHEEPALTLVFCRLKRRVDELARHLNAKGIESHPMHGDMSQSQRSSTMRRFKDGQLAVLIASDLASRGIDVDGISHVINYDLPDDPDLYVHRIGRTARAGMKGVAWSLVTSAQGKLLTQIEDLVNSEIPRMDYPDFEHRERPSDWRDEPTGGRPPLDIPDTGPARNRFEVETPSDVVSKIKKDDLAKKFPGGVVPTKMPPRSMGGRVRRRGK
jgi:ATP-dependent RNA helicase DeaD